MNINGMFKEGKKNVKNVKVLEQTLEIFKTNSN